MSNFKRIMGAFLLALCLSIVAPATVPLTTNITTVEAAKVKLDKSKATLIKGQTLKLEVKNTSKKAKWSTSDKKIATVNSSGKISAKKAGTATITAKIGNQKYTCKITVEQPKLSQTKLTLGKGKSETLSLEGTKQKIKWSTSNKSIATVTSKGKVTGKKIGTAKITAKVGDKKYTCTVTVKKVSATTPVDDKGTQANPLSAYDLNTFNLYSYRQSLGQVQLQLKQCLTGVAAEEQLSTYSKKYTPLPAGQQWVYLLFNAKYLSGTQEIADIDLLWYSDFFNSASNKQLSNYYSGYAPSDSPIPNINDVSLYPSGSTDFYIMFTAPINDFPLTYRINTGYDTKNFRSSYTWFTTQQ
jgi:Bacterial Ig-like domain (group 2)